MKEHEAVLSLGSNLGDRMENLMSAVRMLSEDERIEDIEVSRVYETEPVGYDDQPFFLNICVKFRTSMGPYELLSRCGEIEQELKRVRKIKNGPRTIDLDILTYDDMISDDPKLTIPHPRMYKRAFVLCPYRDIVIYDGPVPEDKSVTCIGPFPDLEEV
ncbi:MAG: 2-amino-4-hydroxy-6-hydroxymethyldihydropteridine diphosphokinase [Clostridiales bacterium]|nr:2-amino-4-hydroxy-6-hydroxymethyldihydropteridine diphosphokinase [Clostridiales bacterium]